MAANLVKAGWGVVAFDTVAERVGDAERLGAQAASSCREVARAADGIVVSIVRRFPRSRRCSSATRGSQALIGRSWTSSS